MNWSDHFAAPRAVWVCVAGIAAWLLLRFHAVVDSRRTRRLLGRRADSLQTGGSDGRLRLVRARRFGLGIVAAGVALMQPLVGEYAHRTDQRGVDVLVALDVSRSMLARDVAPSRLARARDAIRDLVEHAGRGDRFGLVAFAGAARLSIPRTRDRTAFDKLLDLAARTDAIPTAGTDLGQAVRTALGALGDDADRHATIVVVTDGEDHEARGLQAARECLARGVTVHCVGVGGRNGSKIVVASEDGDETFLRDADGRDVVTAMDPVSLRALAAETGGSFLDAAHIARPLVAIYERRILPMAMREFGASTRTTRHNRYQWPLLVAILLWTLAAGFGTRRR